MPQGTEETGHRDTCFVPVEAQTDTLEADRKERTKCIIRPQQVIVPAAMIGLGAAAVCNSRLCDMKMDVRDAMQRGRGDHRKTSAEIWVTLSSQLLVVSLGPKCKHTFVDRMLVKATSYVLLYSTMPIVSRCVHETRPDGHGNHAFPSFKTANAFMAAEQVRIERGWAWGMGMYTMAAGIGVLQMYNDRCYVNDVLAGAGMGILACHAAYWLLPLERRWMKLDKKGARGKEQGARGTKEGARSKGQGASVLFMPTYEPRHHTVGVAFSASL